MSLLSMSIWILHNDPLCGINNGCSCIDDDDDSVMIVDFNDDDDDELINFLF